MTEVFPIAPASAKALWFLGGICALLLGVTATLAWTAYSARHSRIEVSAEGVRLVGDFWGRTIPHGALRLDEAEVVALGHDSPLAPRGRTLGTGLPGYASGWFRLRNGEKALAYLTRSQRVLYVPTTEGFSLLLSAIEPERLLEALRRRAGS